MKSETRMRYNGIEINFVSPTFWIFHWRIPSLHCCTNLESRSRYFTESHDHNAGGPPIPLQTAPLHIPPRQILNVTFAPFCGRSDSSSGFAARLWYPSRAELGFSTCLTRRLSAFSQARAPTPQILLPIEHGYPSGPWNCLEKLINIGGQSVKAVVSEARQTRLKLTSG
jgi:hypothetical protein